MPEKRRFENKAALTYQISINQISLKSDNPQQTFCTQINAGRTQNRPAQLSKKAT